MLPRISDSFSLRFHGVTGGNIPSRTAIHMAENLASVANNTEQERMHRALVKKNVTHPELNIPSRVAQSWGNAANKMLTDNETEQKWLLAYCQGVVESLDRSKTVLGDKILRCHLPAVLQLRMSSRLAMEYGIGRGTNYYLESKIVDLEDELIEKYEELKKTPEDDNDAEGAGSAINNGSGVMAAIDNILSEIKTLKADVIRNKEIMAKVALESALELNDTLEPSLRKIVRKYEGKQQEVEYFAPYIIRSAKTNLERMALMREKESEYENKRDYHRATKTCISSLESDIEKLRYCSAYEFYNRFSELFMAGNG